MSRRRRAMQVRARQSCRKSPVRLPLQRRIMFQRPRRPRWQMFSPPLTSKSRLTHQLTQSTGAWRRVRANWHPMSPTRHPLPLTPAPVIEQPELSVETAEVDASAAAIAAASALATWHAANMVQASPAPPAALAPAQSVLIHEAENRSTDTLGAWVPSRLEEPEPPARLSLPDAPPVEPSPPLSVDEDRAAEVHQPPAPIEPPFQLPARPSEFSLRPGFRLPDAPLPYSHPTIAPPRRRSHRGRC